MTPERVLALLAERVHSLVPDGHSAQLRDESTASLRTRAICGDHGHIVVTRQGLCPLCAGVVLDAAIAAKIQRLAFRLDEAGLYDREFIGWIRARPFYHPQPHL